MTFAIQALTRRHERDDFDSGEPDLDEYLRRYARQNQDKGIGRTYVAVPKGQGRVVGYYTLSAGSVEFEVLPPGPGKRLPRYPVPVAHLGRLATCRSVRGHGLGEVLLFDAMARTLTVANEIGIAAIEVWARTDRVRRYYRKYGFTELVDDVHHMYLPLATVRQLLPR